MGDTGSMQVARRCGSGWAPGSAPSRAFQIWQTTCRTAPKRLEFGEVGKAPSVLNDGKGGQKSTSRWRSVQIQGQIGIEADTTSTAPRRCPDWMWGCLWYKGSCQECMAFPSAVDTGTSCNSVWSCCQAVTTCSSSRKA